jgi:hypothetical protein
VHVLAVLVQAVLVQAVLVQAVLVQAYATFAARVAFSGAVLGGYLLLAASRRPALGVIR